MKNESIVSKLLPAVIEEVNSTPNTHTTLRSPASYLQISNQKNIIKHQDFEFESKKYKERDFKPHSHHPARIAIRVPNKNPAYNLANQQGIKVSFEGIKISNFEPETEPMTAAVNSKLQSRKVSRGNGN